MTQLYLSHLLCRLVLFTADKVMESEFRWSCHGLQFPLAVVAGLRVSLDGVTPQRQRGELLPRVLSPARDQGDHGRGVQAQRAAAGKNQLRRKIVRKEGVTRLQPTYLTFKIDPVFCRPPGWRGLTGSS